MLKSQLMEPIRKQREFVPYSCRRVLEAPGSSVFANPARWTFDMGREISGHVRLSIPSGTPAGTVFTLSHAEILSHPPLHIVENGKTLPQISNYDGSVYTGNLFWAKPVDIFEVPSVSSSFPNTTTLTYEPRFTYHGFRYVELSVTPPLPDDIAAKIDDSTVTGIQIRSNARSQADVKVQ